MPAGPDVGRWIDRELADPATTRAQKIQRLVDMGIDALALERASGEGMAGPASGLQRIHGALRTLGEAATLVAMHGRRDARS